MTKGSVVFATHIRHQTPGCVFDVSAPKGHLFVFVVLGTMEKKEGATFDTIAALRDLGWKPADEASPEPATPADGGAPHEA